MWCLSCLAANDRALCRCGIRIPSARNRCPVFDKDKCLEPRFGDVGQARTKAAMLLLPIDTTSSRTCTKPIVSCRNGWLKCELLPISVTQWLFLEVIDYNIKHFKFPFADFPHTFFLVWFHNINVESTSTYLFPLSTF